MKNLTIIPLAALVASMAFSCAKNEPIEPYKETSFTKIQALDTTLRFDGRMFDTIEMVTREMEVPDYSTIITTDRVVLHYRSDKGKPFVRITAPRQLIDKYTPRVQKGALLITDWFSHDTSSLYDIPDDINIVVETNSHHLKGFGNQTIGLGDLALKLRSKGDFDWEEDFIHHCYLQHVLNNGKITMTAYQCNDLNHIDGFTIRSHRKGGLTTLDMVYDTVDYNTAIHRKLVESHFSILDKFKLIEFSEEDYSTDYTDSIEEAFTD